MAYSNGTTIIYKFGLRDDYDNLEREISKIVKKHNAPHRNSGDLRRSMPLDISKRLEMIKRYRGEGKISKHIYLEIKENISSFIFLYDTYMYEKVMSNRSIVISKEKSKTINYEIF